MSQLNIECSFTKHLSIQDKLLLLKFLDIKKSKIVNNNLCIQLTSDDIKKIQTFNNNK